MAKGWVLSACDPGEITIGHDTTERRVCGSCTACCTVMKITQMESPAGASCRHISSSGCAIYDNRPAGCSGFRCLWLADQRDVLLEQHRPDQIGLVLTDTTTGTDGSPAIAARELVAGAAESQEGRDLIGYLSRFIPVRVVPAHGVELTLNGHAMCA